MSIRQRNIHPDAAARQVMITWEYGDNTATAALLDSDFPVQCPYNGRLIEIGVAAGLGAGAANSGSASLRFYRAGSATFASATTTNLLHSGTISIGSGTTVGVTQTATLNTSVLVGPAAGMLVTAGTSFLVSYDTTATNTTNVLSGYFKIIVDD